MIKDTNLGQVWTPKKIALKMTRDLITHIPKNKNLKILDPAAGPGTFTDALLEEKLINKRKFQIVNYDIDRRWIEVTDKLTVENNINAENINADYLLSKHKWAGKFDAIIMNPPYIRHEKIDQSCKKKYIKNIEKEYNLKIDGRSNLFVFFILKAIQDLRIGGILSAIVYDGIQYTKYGKQLLKIVEEYTDNVKIENIKMPFDKVLVDAQIITCRKRKHKKEKEKNNDIPINQPKIKNYAYIKELLEIKRGTELINNRIFLANENEPYFKYAKDFFKKQNKLSKLIIPNSWIEKAYIFDGNCKVPEGFEEWVAQRSEKLINENGAKSYKVLEYFLRERKKGWYRHKTVTGDIVFNYYFRGKPKYILNPKNITISNNYYAINPINLEKEIAWLLLNTDIYKDNISKNARSQGNGLFKIQVYEYKNSLVPDWRLLDNATKKRLHKIAIDYMKENKTELLQTANRIIQKSFS